MPTELLPLGRPVSLAQNAVYALPARRCILFTTGTPTILQANVVAMTAPVTVTLSGGQAEVAGPFIQCTSGAIIVTLKAA